MQNDMKDRLIDLLINADVYDSYECKLCTKEDYCDYCNAEKLADHLIKNGVVPVVRCCDCKHRQENPDIDNTCYLTCNKTYGIQGTIEPDDYCSYGERK